MNTDSPVSTITPSQTGLVPAAENGPDNHKIDFSAEHTNGRMFEQAVQNANKTHETSAPPDNVRYSDSKVDQDAKACNDKPLVLNDKNPKQEKELFTKESPAASYIGEEAIWQALLRNRIVGENLSKLSRDLVALNGQEMDKLLNERHEKNSSNKADPNHGDARTDDGLAKNGSIKIGTHHDVHVRKSRRAQIHELAVETYHDLLKIEGELGNHIRTGILKELDARRFGRDVVGLLFK